MSDVAVDLPQLLGVAPSIDLAGGAQLQEISAAWELGLGSYNPPAEVQARFVGSSGAAALQEGNRFVDLVFSSIAAGGRSVTDLEVLDFAAGWGRIARSLAQHAGPASLWCAELLPLARAYCSLGVPGASVVAVNVAPPTKLQRDSFDLVTGYSVFTHLPRSLHEDWVAELARLVRKGGTVAVTYWDQWFLDLCESARRGEIAGATAWHEGLAKRFTPYDAHVELLEKEGHLFVGSGGGQGLEAETYGESVVTRSYVENAWSVHGLRLEVWDDSRTVTPQAVAILVAD